MATGASAAERSRRGARQGRLATAALAALAGCTSASLTGALWKGATFAEEVTVEEESRLSGARPRGRLDGPAGERVLALQVIAGVDAPPGIGHYTGDRPGWLVLRPWLDDGGAEPEPLPPSPFRPQLVDVDLEDIRHTGDGVRATVTTMGMIPREHLFTEVAGGEAPAAWRSLGAIDRARVAAPALRRCLDAFTAQDWPHLLGVESGRGDAPLGLAVSMLAGPAAKAAIGWVDDRGAVVATPDLESDLRRAADPAAALARHRLLARVTGDDGRPRFLLVAPSALLHADGKRLEPSGASIGWMESGVWAGRLGRHDAQSAALPLADVALLDDTIGYRWQSTYTDRHWLATAGRIVLTPVAVVTDVLVSTNPGLAELRAQLLALFVVQEVVRSGRSGN